MFEVITVEELSNYIDDGITIEWKKKQYYIYPDWYTAPGEFVITDEDGNRITAITSNSNLLVLEEDRTKDENTILRVLEVIE